MLKMKVATAKLSSYRGKAELEIKWDAWRGWDQHSRGLALPVEREWIAGDEMHGLMRYAGSEGGKYWKIHYQDRQCEYFATIFNAESDRQAFAHVGLKVTLIAGLDGFAGPDWLISVDEFGNDYSRNVGELSEKRIDYLYNAGVDHFS